MAMDRRVRDIGPEKMNPELTAVVGAEIVGGEAGVTESF